VILHCSGLPHSHAQQPVAQDALDQRCSEAAATGQLSCKLDCEALAMEEHIA
jgi:hypothetical protein